MLDPGSGILKWQYIPVCLPGKNPMGKGPGGATKESDMTGNTCTALIYTLPSKVILKVLFLLLLL